MALAALAAGPLADAAGEMMERKALLAALYKLG